jgi:hypothetical protein
MYSVKARRTIEALARVYAADLGDDEVRAVVAHSEQFFAALPLRFRLVVRLVLALFRWSGRLVAPRRRSFLAKSPAEQALVYDRWFARGGYLTVLLGQVLHLTFVGSVYALPRIQAKIGYELS